MWSTSSSSVEQQHHDFKRQISSQETFPCFLLDQSSHQRQQRLSSPTSNIMPSFSSALAFGSPFSPAVKSPMSTMSNTSRLVSKQQQPSTNPYRLFASNTSTNPIPRTSSNARPVVSEVPVGRTVVPLRTMSDVFPSFTYTSMTKRKNPFNYSINANDLPASVLTTGVSIFGFREEDLEIIIRQFEDIGQVNRIERPIGGEDGNYVNIIYSNHVACQNALNRDGMLFNGTMIGIVPIVVK